MSTSRHTCTNKTLINPTGDSGHWPGARKYKTKGMRDENFNNYTKFEITYIYAPEHGQTNIL